MLLSLNLASNDITTFGVEKLKQALLTTDLKELDVSGNPLGNQGIECVGQYVGHSSCVLERLNVGECKFQSQGAITLFGYARKNPYLKFLTMDKNDIRSRNSSYLYQAIYQGLVYLSMNRCNIGDDGGQHIAEGVSRSKSLKTLLLQYNSLSDSAASCFAEAL